MNAWLIDDRWGKAYPLASDMTIGRGVHCAIILRDPAVSRVHAEVRATGSEFVLRPLGASGTVLNGVAIDAERALAEGDVVEIAYTTLRFTTRPPTSEVNVITRDRPTPLDTETPTRSTIRAALRPPIIGHSDHTWRRLWRWLTRRRNTE